MAPRCGAIRDFAPCPSLANSSSLGKLERLKHFRKRLITSVALLLGTALFAACSAPQPVNPTPIPDLPTPAAPTYSVQRGIVARGVEFNARVQPASSETLSFQTDGRIYKLNVKEGDLVKAGDVLAELDLNDLKKQLESELVRLRTAEAVLSNTVRSFSDTLRLAELDLDQARLRYESARARASGGSSVLQNDLRRIDKRIADIQNSIRQARENFDQAGADNAQKLLEDAEIERERILANLSDSDRNLRALEIDARILAADVSRAEIRTRQLRSQIDPGQIEAVETARIAVEATQSRIANGSLIAPFDGEVGLITVRVGGNVSALSPLMVVAKPGELELLGSPSEEQLSEISVGQQVTVTFLAADIPAMPGRVERVPIIGNQVGAGSERSRVVRIALPADAKLVSGAIARINTFSQRRDDVLWIPPAALRTFRTRRFVVVRNSDSTERRVDVKTGLESADRVEIVDGLKEGELVVAP
jgi:multidrug efflux pump subunit AcrA (membrane-fusion protein)